MYPGLILAFLAGLNDYRHGTIPNRLTLPALVLGLSVSFLPGGITPAEAALGTTFSALPSFSMFMATKGKAIGGGDVKLVAALGAWMGPDIGLTSQLAGLLLCASWSCLRAIRKKHFACTGARDSGERLGPFLFLGTLAASLLNR